METLADKHRLLVVIASYGNRNIELLKKVIGRYRGMAMEVDIVVLSEAPKVGLGPGVRVEIGLPSENPWSLPFGHKRIFADNVDRYDLFAYTEDDIEITETHLRSFLRITAMLPPDEIAGFLRFETDEAGFVTLPDVNGPFHWKPGTVQIRGECTVAEFTNEHAAFFVLTQEQLRVSIASGGFLRAPYEGRYDMLCTAATDPYTSCGLKKVIPISHLDSFLIHHLSNRYSGKLGPSLDAFKQQIQTLSDIGMGKHPSTTLTGVETRIRGLRWSKSYYEKPADQVLAMVKPEARNLLSVGCGWGDTEESLQARGVKVTALPLDSVIGAAAARRGIEMVYGEYPQCWKDLEGRRFQNVLVTHLLHLQEDPRTWIEYCANVLANDGALLVSGPNFEMLPVAAKRLVGSGEFCKLGDFRAGGINPFGVSAVKRWMNEAGLRVDSVRWYNSTVRPYSSGAFSRWQRFRSKLRRRLFDSGESRLTAENWVIRGLK